MGEREPWRPAVTRSMGKEVLRVQVKVAFWQAECIHWPGLMLVFYGPCTAHSAVFIESNL